MLHVSLCQGESVPDLSSCLQVPIYVSSAMATRANAFFKLLQNWASERVKQAVPGCRASAFDFSRVQDWQPELVDKPVGQHQGHAWGFASWTHCLE